MIYNVAIIGGGVIGGMIARELTRYNLKICILEKENDICMGASKANSGIVHGGYDPTPNTLKAKMNSIGVNKLYTAAKELNVPIKNNKSLVCAFGKDEEPAIHDLFKRGNKNGIYDIEIINKEKIKQLEPNISNDVSLALYVKNAGIVSPYELTIAAIGNALDNGAKLYRNFEVIKIDKNDNNTYTLYSNNNQITATYVINCAGAYSDKISALVGDDSFKIIPRAGEYMLLDKSEGGLVTHTIFQVPTKNGKGILVTPTVDGNILLGPTAEVVKEKNDTLTTQNGLNTIINLAKKSVPSINFRSVITSFSGVRASNASNDFIIKESSFAKNFINVAAIDSPGLTSCVAIAEYVVNILNSIGLKLTANQNFNGTRPDPHAFKKMTDQEKDEYIKLHPNYGKIVCRCEGISEGEIIDAIMRNPKAYDLDAVKRRTRSGMGRCQGGFCAPFVIKILSQVNNTNFNQITKKGSNSKITFERL